MKEQLHLDDCKKKTETASLSKKCNWTAKWRQETFLGLSLRESVWNQTLI